MEILQKKLVIILIGLLAIFFFPGVLHAADISFSPSSGSYAVGQTFSVSVMVSSADQSMNASSGVITFQKDLLQVVSLSKTGSIFNLWVQEPSFSNNNGTAKYEGVVLNPGFRGSSGKLITINFRAIGTGITTVSFYNGSVLANDGNGTEILQNSGAARFTLTATPAPEVSETPLGSAIVSPTHPDQNKWYSNNDPQFKWNVGSDITAARLQYDKNPAAEPTILYTSAISEKHLENITDGTYYFHVQLRNTAGWGSIEHFKFNIDTEKPNSFSVEEIIRQDATDPKARFKFLAQDSLSGISHYEVKIDEGNWQTWIDDGTHVFQTVPVGPGDHALFAKVIDRAGNFLTGSADFSVQALPTPSIEEYPKQVNSGEAILISGKAIQNVDVILYMQRGSDAPQQFVAESNSSGAFSVNVVDKIKGGVYKAWVQARDKRGATSELSPKVTILVNQPALFAIGTFVINLLVIIICIIALLLLLLLTAWWSWHKMMLIKRKMKKEIHYASNHIHKAFDVLKEEIESQIKLLDMVKSNRPLNDIEQKIIKNLKKKLDKAETLIEREIEDIEKDVFH